MSRVDNMGFFSFFSKQSPPVEVESPKGNLYEPLPKHYVFNETGNIMLCTTKADVENINDEFKSICAEVSVFFAAMTKAIHSVKNPATKEAYSIYNYRAVEKVLFDSGMFIEVNKEQLDFTSTRVGNSIGKELMQAVLGREFSETRLSFAKSMFSAMRHQHTLEANIEANAGGENNSQSQTNNAGSIFFVCESLLGMPQISAVLVSIKPVSVDQEKKPESDCLDFFDLVNWNDHEHTCQNRTRCWEFTKHTYLFVPPKFFKSYIGDINAANTSEFDSYIESLASSLERLNNTSQKN